VDTTRQFVRAVVTKVLQRELGEDADIFQHGCDSLQATWIRNTLLRAVREAAELDTRQSADNFVYRQPTIGLLSGYIFKLVSGGSVDAESNERRIETMIHAVEKYTQNFGPLKQRTRLGDEKVVLLTGTTGGLGSNALSVLVHDPNVKKIYALNRKGQTEVKVRQKQALLERGLDDAVFGLDSGKVVLLEGDAALSGLGLSSELLNEVSFIAAAAKRNTDST
jgi:hypothetical protein